MARYTQQDLADMAATIFGEAGGEGYQGKIAVGNVVKNRMKLGDASVADVVYGSSSKKNGQFSIFNNSRGYSAIERAAKDNSKAWQDSVRAAKAVLEGKVKDNTKGATHYYNPKRANPRWKSSGEKTATIGNHTFRKLEGTGFQVKASAASVHRRAPAKVQNLSLMPDTLPALPRPAPGAKRRLSVLEAAEELNRKIASGEIVNPLSQPAPIPPLRQADTLPQKAGLDDVAELAALPRPGPRDQIPEFLLDMPVKVGGVNNTTIGEITPSFKGLHNSGVQAFSGGFNNPETLIATGIMREGMGDNFNRLTAQFDGFHAAKRPNSRHNLGVKSDFTAHDYNQAMKDAAAALEDVGLEKKDYRLNYEGPGTRGSTAPHMDFELLPSGQSIIRGLDLASLYGDGVDTFDGSNISASSEYGLSQGGASAPVDIEALSSMAGINNFDQTALNDEDIQPKQVNTFSIGPSELPSMGAGYAEDPVYSGAYGGDYNGFDLASFNTLESPLPDFENDGINFKTEIDKSFDGPNLSARSEYGLSPGGWASPASIEAQPASQEPMQPKQVNTISIGPDDLPEIPEVQVGNKTYAAVDIPDLDDLKARATYAGDELPELSLPELSLPDIGTPASAAANPLDTSGPVAGLGVLPNVAGRVLPQGKVANKTPKAVSRAVKGMTRLGTTGLGALAGGPLGALAGNVAGRVVQDRAADRVSDFLRGGVVGASGHSYATGTGIAAGLNKVNKTGNWGNFWDYNSGLDQEAQLAFDREKAASEGRELKSIGDKISEDLGGTIICSELYRQGLMSRDIWQADEKWGRMIARQDPDIIRGYRHWAAPVVRLMRRSRLAARVISVLTKPWSYQMAYEAGLWPRGNILGRITNAVGIPASWAVGKALKLKRKR